MKDMKGLTIGSLIFITIFTILGLVSMMPHEGDISFENMDIGYRPSGELGDKIAMDPRDEYFYGEMDNVQVQDEYVIDDRTLNQFIDLYLGKILESNEGNVLTVMEKEEVRLILEDMGLNNTSKLKEILSGDWGNGTVDTVKNILDENLFYDEIQRLTRLIGGTK